MFVLGQPEGPGRVDVSVDFGTINWWWYTILLAIVFLIVATVGKQKWAWRALAVMVVFALVYALAAVYVIPKLFG